MLKIKPKKSIMAIKRRRIREYEIRNQKNKGRQTIWDYLNLDAQLVGKGEKLHLVRASLVECAKHDTL